MGFKVIDILIILEIPVEHVLGIKDFTTQDMAKYGLSMTKKGGIKLRHFVQQLLQDYEPKRFHKIFTRHQAEQIRQAYHILEEEWKDHCRPQPPNCDIHFEDIIDDITIIEEDLSIRTIAEPPVDLDAEIPRRKVRELSDSPDIGTPAKNKNRNKKS